MCCIGIVIQIKIMKSNTIRVLLSCNVGLFCTHFYINSVNEYSITLLVRMPQAMHIILNQEWNMVNTSVLDKALLYILISSSSEPLFKILNPPVAPPIPKLVPEPDNIPLRVCCDCNTPLMYSFKVVPSQVRAK